MIFVRSPRIYIALILHSSQYSGFYRRSCSNFQGVRKPIRGYPCALSRDFLSLFFLRRALGRDRKCPGPPSFVLSLSLSPYHSFLILSRHSTECERKIKRTKARKRGRKTLTRISLRAREESTREEMGQTERERGDADAPRKELSFSPSHTRPGWLTHHYRQFINSQ